MSIGSFFTRASRRCCVSAARIATVLLAMGTSSALAAPDCDVVIVESGPLQSMPGGQVQFTLKAVNGMAGECDAANVPDGPGFSVFISGSDPTGSSAPTPGSGFIDNSSADPADWIQVITIDVGPNTGSVSYGVNCTAGCAGSPVIKFISLNVEDHHEVRPFSGPSALVSVVRNPATIDFVVDIDKNGSPVIDGECVDIETIPPPGQFSDFDFCPDEIKTTGGKASVNLEFLLSRHEWTFEPGVWQVSIHFPSGGLGKSAGFGYQAHTFTFEVVEPQLAFFSPPSEIVLGEPAEFILQLTDGTGSPLDGYAIDWTQSGGMASLQTSSGTTPATAGGMASFSVTATGHGDLTLTANVAGVELGDVTAVTNLFAVAYGLEFEVEPNPGPYFSDETAPELQVRPTKAIDNTPDPENGVNVTYVISSGNAVFQDNGLDTITVPSSDGFSRSGPIDIGRTNTAVVIDISATNRSETLQANYDVTASTYELVAISPLEQNINDTQVATLEVKVQRSGSGSAVPLENEVVTWDISPATASIVSPSPATNADGHTSTTLTPTFGVGAEYNVTATFNTGITAPATSPFTVNVTAPTRTLTAVSPPNLGELQLGDAVQVRVRADDDAEPSAALPTIAWEIDPSSTGSGTFDPPSMSADSGTGEAFTSFTASTAGSVTIIAKRVDVADAEVSFTLETFTFELSMVPANGELGGETLTDIPMVTRLQRVGANTTNAAEQDIHYSIQGGPPGHAAQLEPSDLGRTGFDGLASVALNADLPGLYDVKAEYPAPVIRGKSAAKALPIAPVSFRVQVNEAVVDRTLSLISGDGQSARANESLGAPLVVEAQNNGVPAAGIGISWSVAPEGAATVTPNPSETMDGGQSSVSVTLASTAIAGTNITITALRDDGGEPVPFTVTVLPDVVRTLAIISGDNQSARAGETLAAQLVVEARDDASPIDGVQISWSVDPPGVATVAPNPSSTMDGGRSGVSVTFASTVAPETAIRITASRDGGDPVTFNATVQAEVVRSLSLVSGDNQSALAGQPLPLPLVVEARDDADPAIGVQITWTVDPPGAATVDPNPSNTIEDGSSSVNVMLSPTASPEQPITIIASRGIATSAPVRFNVSVQPPPVVKVLTKPASDSGDGQSGQVRTMLPLPLKALALNSGVPAGGVVVRWVASGDVVLSAPETTTNEFGLTEVEVTLGNTASPEIFITASRADASTATTSYVVSAVAAPVETLGAVAGNNQVGLLNQPAEPLQVKYAIDGVGVANTAVSWQLLSGAASLSTSNSSTNGSGVAQVGLTFGATPGPVVVQASVGTLVARFSLSAVAAMISIDSGSGQSGPTGSTLPADFVARISLPGGAKSLAGVEVTWEVIEGGGSVSPGSSQTNELGMTATRMTLGSSPGENVVRASVPGGNSVEFRATGVGPTLRLVSGTGQSGPIQTLGLQPLVVELADANGNPLAGRTVAWTTVSGPVVLDATGSVTDASGRAQVGFRYGDVPGGATVRASTADAAPVDFMLQATQASFTGPSQGSGQSAAPGEELPEDFVVSIAPPPGKSLAGVTVFWEVTAGGGSLRSPTSQTDANGEARNRLTLGPEPGMNEVRASIPGGGEVIFQAEAVIPVGELRIVSGNSQTLPTNDPSDPLVIELLDTRGTPIAGATIRWTPVRQMVGSEERANARVEHETTVTDAQGRSSNIARVLLPGPARIRVEAANIDAAAVEFALNGGVANIPSLNEEQERTSRAIDNACPALAALPNRTPEQEDLYQRCLELIDNAGNNPDEVENALDEIPNQLGSSLVDAGFGTLSTQFGNHSTRFEVLRKGQGSGGNQFNVGLWTPAGVLPLSFLPSAFVQNDASTSDEHEAGSGFERWGFFATGTLGRGKARGEQGRGGVNFDTTGLTSGIDYRFSDRLVGGVSLGYARHDSELRGGLGSLDTRGWTVSGYATWFNERNWYIDGVLSYGNNDYRLERTLAYSITALDGGRTVVDQRARADTDGTLLGSAFSFGRDFQKGPWNFSSYLRGNYSRVELDGYEERMLQGRPGAGLALRFDARTLHSVTSALGGKATYVLSRDWGILMPHLQVEWEHQFRDDPANLTASFVHDPTGTRMQQSGAAIDTDYYNVGFGLSALFPGGRAAYLYYERLLGASRLSQGTLSIGARFEF
jgi:uncharacterized protein YhjY with autotransporter beta-barrel domain